MNCESTEPSYVLESVLSGSYARRLSLERSSPSRDGSLPPGGGGGAGGGFKEIGGKADEDPENETETIFSATSETMRHILQIVART